MPKDVQCTSVNCRITITRNVLTPNLPTLTDRICHFAGQPIRVSCLNLFPVPLSVRRVGSTECDDDLDSRFVRSRDAVACIRRII